LCFIIFCVVLILWGKHIGAVWNMMLFYVLIGLNTIAGISLRLHFVNQSEKFSCCTPESFLCRKRWLLLALSDVGLKKRLFHLEPGFSDFVQCVDLAWWNDHVTNHVRWKQFSGSCKRLVRREKDWNLKNSTLCTFWPGHVFF